MNNCYLSIDDKILVSTDKEIELRNNHINIEHELELENKIEKINNDIESIKSDNLYNRLWLKNMKKINNLSLIGGTFILFVVNPLTIFLSLTIILANNLLIDQAVKKGNTNCKNKVNTLYNERDNLNNELITLRNNKIDTNRVNSKILEYSKNSREEIIKLYYLREKLEELKTKSQNSIDDIWNSNDIVSFKKSYNKVKGKIL